ncbi:MAG: glutathione S-transferase family protein [Caulobacterales bacterium]
MKLYGERNPAPHPRRVRIFIAEKGIDLPETRVKLLKGEHKSAEHVARNSLGQIPTLELDDGTFISESNSICRYLEAQFPDKPLFGCTPKEIGLIDMWIRRIELRIYDQTLHYWRYGYPRAGAEQPFKAFGDAAKPRYEQELKWLDSELANCEFIAGDAYSYADIIGLTSIDFGTYVGWEIPAECKNVLAWHARVSARPSAEANS